MNFTPTDQQLEQNRSRAEDEIDLRPTEASIVAGRGSPVEHPRPHLLRISTDRLQACLSRRISDRSQEENASSGVASYTPKTRIGLLSSLGGANGSDSIATG